MLKWQQLDKPTTPSSSLPPLLTLPIPHPITPLHHSSSITPPSHHSSSTLLLTRLPIIEVLVFARENILGWLFQINHFFAFHQIPNDQRISIVVFYMAGPALQWFHWLHWVTGMILFTKSSYSLVPHPLLTMKRLSSSSNKLPPLRRTCTSLNASPRGSQV